MECFYQSHDKKKLSINIAIILLQIFCFHEFFMLQPETEINSLLTLIF